MSVFADPKELEGTLQILDELAEDTEAHCQSAWEFGAQVLGLISDLQRGLAQAVVAEKRARSNSRGENIESIARPTSKTDELHKTLKDEGYLLIKWSTLKRKLSTSKYRELKQYVRERNL